LAIQALPVYADNARTSRTEWGALSRTLRVGAFQFAAGSHIPSNVAALERGIVGASREGVRLLLTQECGLCGYPPVERDAVASLDQGVQREALEYLAGAAKQHDLFVVIGMITAHRSGFRNSVCLVGPDGTTGRIYHKRALWGWDTRNYLPGDTPGVYEVEGIKVGLRVCYEARFPEYFRELFRQQVDLALVALSNVGDAARRGKTEVYKAHLVSRASENAMWVLSANSTSRVQLAPSCLIDPDGSITAECKVDQEDLVTGTIRIGEPSFGAQGRIAISRALTGMDSGNKPAV
jgi:omega-amidase